MKVSGTTTSRITTPAVTASSNQVAITAGKTTTSKQVGTPAVVATSSVKTTNTGTTATRITTPAVVAGHVTTTGSSGSAKRVGTPAVTTYAATNGTSRTLSTPAVTRDAAALQAARSTLTKNLTAPKAEENSFMDGVHTVLDAAGYIPCVGDLADLINSVIYAAEGDWTDAVISAAAVFVDGATAGRLARNSMEIAGEAVETVTKRAVKNSSGKFVGEATGDIGQDIAEEIWDEISEYIEEIEENESSSLQDIADKAAREYNEKYKPFERAITKGYMGVKKTQNGGVSFQGTSYIHKINGAETKITILATGNRSDDFDYANSKFGFDDTPDGYVWHHLDDYNVDNNTITMELIKKEAHNATKPHSGGCAQYDAVHGPSYNPARKGGN